MTDDRTDDDFYVVFAGAAGQAQGEAVPSPDERRRDVRVPIEIWAEESSGGDLIYNCTANLSRSGVFFDQAVPCKVGTRLALRIPLPESGGEITAEGEVVRIAESGSGMGIRFTSLEAGAREALERLLRAAR